MITFTLNNQSASVDANTLQQTMDAILLAANRDFLPAWDFGQAVSLAPAGGIPILLTDSTAEQGAEGYHDDEGGNPGIVIQVPDVPAGQLASTISHEVFETLADKLAVLLVHGPWQSPVCFECADPVEDQSYDVNGVQVSNFVLPSWFVDGSKGPWDFMGKLTAPFTLSSGGYVAFDNDTVQWGSQDRAKLGLKSWKRVKRLRCGR